MISVVDFGSQYTHLIAQKIRKLNVYAEIVNKIKADDIKSDIEGIILSGGPNSVYDAEALDIDKEIFNLGIPVLGICYGLQLIGKHFNGSVSAGKKEYGPSKICVLNKESLFKGLPDEFKVWMSHGDSINSLDTEILASTENCRYAAIKKENIYGVQFHPEVQHTENGLKVLDNFLYICNCVKDYSLEDFIEKQVNLIRKKVGAAKVLMAASGGIDSTVAALLIQKAIGDNLHCVFVDNGLLRKNEAVKVIELFGNYFKNFHFIDANELFLWGLEGVREPEKKREVIGELFIALFEEKAEELEKLYGKFGFLGQGTLYPDRIESAQASKSADRVKGHHNVAYLPEKMKLQLIEPLADLYKNEVREIGLKLGLPYSIVYNHPFPGPGLAVRLVDQPVTKEKLDILREADVILREELVNNNLYYARWQAFPVLLGKSVGIKGDKRSYEHIVSIRIVDSEDGMTADWTKLPPDIVNKLSRRIANEVKGVNRVLIDITSKPPATIEYE